MLRENFQLYNNLFYSGSALRYQASSQAPTVNNQKEIMNIQT